MLRIDKTITQQLQKVLWSCRTSPKDVLAVTRSGGGYRLVARPPTDKDVVLVEGLLVGPPDISTKGGVYWNGDVIHLEVEEG